MSTISIPRPPVAREIEAARDARNTSSADPWRWPYVLPDVPFGAELHARILTLHRTAVHLGRDGERLARLLRDSERALDDVALDALRTGEPDVARLNRGASQWIDETMQLLVGANVARDRADHALSARYFSAAGLCLLQAGELMSAAAFGCDLPTGQEAQA